jgi:selenocysteine-specific translation elongation factor
LIGTNSHLKDESIISSEGVKSLAKELGCVNYFEVSAQTGEGVDALFNELFSFYATLSKGFYSKKILYFLLYILFNIT